MMLQDIYPSHLYNQYKSDKTPKPQDFVFVFKLTRYPEVLAKKDEDIKFPTVADIGDLTGYQLQYLFAVDDEDYFLLVDEDQKPVKDFELSEGDQGFDYISIRALGENDAQPRYRVYAANTAKHLADWYRDFVFCGRCGTKTIHSETERAKVCPVCGNANYPRIMPAVIVGVINGDSILLTKYRTGFNHNALIAGFTEIGETMEETVSREVMEETGIKVKNIRYYKSQPWGVANDMLLGYYCELDGDPTIHMDSEELKFAEWVHYDDIVFQPGNVSLTNEMMKHFAQTKGRWLDED